MRNGSDPVTMASASPVATMQAANTFLSWFTMLDVALR